MADRYDPKLSVRPLSERKPANPAAGDEDPLVELARIVSGRTTFDPGPAQRSKTVPVNGSVSSDVALANDLESELLNDLQASFSSTFYSPPPPPPPPPPAPAAQKPAAQPAKPASPPPAKPPSAAAASGPAAAVPAQPAPLPSQPEKPAVRSERPAPVAAARAEKPASQAPQAPAKSERSAAPPAPSAERVPFARQASVTAEKLEKIDLPEAQLRSTAAAHPPTAEAVPAKPAGRWERPAEPRVATPDPSRFAPPPRGAALFRPKAPTPEPEPEEDELPDLAALAEGEDEPYEEEGPPAEDLDALPQLYDDDDAELPPFPDELEDLSGRRPRRGLYAVVALLAVALAGGVAFVMLRSESSVATPPIITADATPAKIVPAATPSDTDEQNKLIYDRVDGAQSADGTKLVTPGDEPVSDSPAGAPDANNPISRVIAPGGPGFDAPVKDGDPAADAAASDETASASAASEAGGGSIPPKKVRTVTVGPDMTVISSGAAAADAAGKAPAADAGVPPAAPASAEASPKAAPGIPPKKTETDDVADGQGLPIAVDADPLSSGGDKTASAGAAPADPIEPVAPGSVPAIDGDAAAAAAAEGGAAAVADASGDPPVAAEAAPPAKPAQRPATKPVVLATRGGALDLTPAKPGKASPATQSGSVLVQVSAQKSEDAAKASYRDLQGKFPSILGRLDPNIQRADLGEKGVYYRVRVGPFAAADAQRLCGDLQAAGGSCLIAKH